MTDTERSLLTAVCAAPADDWPRLVYADWLEDRDPERAAFIRVQCGRVAAEREYDECLMADLSHCDSTRTAATKRRKELVDREVELWLQVRDSYTPCEMQFIIENGRMRDRHRPSHVIVRRGFPDVIQCTLAEFVGEGCWACHGQRGRTVQNGGYREFSGSYPTWQDCSICSGTGRRERLAEVAAREMWPVTGVRLTGVEPINTGEFGWRFTAANQLRGPYMLPYEIYQALPGWRPSGQTQPTWRSRDLALAALSDAGVRVIGGRRTK